MTGLQPIMITVLGLVVIVGVVVGLYFLSTKFKSKKVSNILKNVSGDLIREDDDVNENIDSTENIGVQVNDSETNKVVQVNNNATNVNSVDNNSTDIVQVNSNNSNVNNNSNVINK